MAEENFDAREVFYKHRQVAVLAPWRKADTAASVQAALLSGSKGFMRDATMMLANQDNLQDPAVAHSIFTLLGELHRQDPLFSFATHFQFYAHLVVTRMLGEPRVLTGDHPIYRQVDGIVAHLPEKDISALCCFYDPATAVQDIAQRPDRSHAVLAMHLITSFARPDDVRTSDALSILGALEDAGLSDELADMQLLLRFSLPPAAAGATSTSSPSAPVYRPLVFADAASQWLDLYLDDVRPQDVPAVAATLLETAERLTVADTKGAADMAQRLAPLLQRALDLLDAQAPGLRVDATNAWSDAHEVNELSSVLFPDSRRQPHRPVAAIGSGKNDPEP